MSYDAFVSGTWYKYRHSLRFLKISPFSENLNKMNLTSKQEKIDLLTEQIRQIQSALTLLQDQQEDNLVWCKTFVFYFWLFLIIKQNLL